LQDVTIAQLVETQKFRDNLAAYMTAQKEDRAAIQKSYMAMKKLGGAKGYKLPSHPIDKVINLSVGEFANEYLAIINHVSKRPFAERRYIFQLGNQAYNLTIAQIVVEEFPELADELIPKSNGN
jgi:hypothetical protein